MENSFDGFGEQQVHLQDTHLKNYPSASLTTEGTVKLCEETTVTNSTGLALPASEKNPNAEGTLARSIAQIGGLNTERFPYPQNNMGRLKDQTVVALPGSSHYQPFLRAEVMYV